MHCLQSGIQYGLYLHLSPRDTIPCQRKRNNPGGFFQGMAGIIYKMLRVSFKWIDSWSEKRLCIGINCVHMSVYSYANTCCHLVRSGSTKIKVKKFLEKTSLFFTGFIGIQYSKQRWLIICRNNFLNDFFPRQSSGYVLLYVLYAHWSPCIVWSYRLLQKEVHE